MAILTPSLVKLRDGFNLIAPGRDKASDGWIGNTAHAASTSGHNPDETGRAERQDADRIDEVRALDVDKDLRTPGLTMQQCVQRILDTAADRRRLIYIIWNRTIWSASNGWKPRAYTGSNAHTQHAHFSGHPDYDTDTAPWGIEELIEMDKAEVKAALLDAAQDPKFRAAIVEALRTRQPWVSEGVQKYATEDPRGPRFTVDLSQRLALEYGWQQAHLVHNTDVPELKALLATLAAQILELRGLDFTDEQAIVDGVLAGLGTRDLDEAAAALVAAFGDRAAELAARLAEATTTQQG